MKKNILSVCAVLIFAILAGGSTDTQNQSSTESIIENGNEKVTENIQIENLQEESDDNSENKKVSSDEVWLIMITGSVVPRLEATSESMIQISQLIENDDFMSAIDEMEKSLQEFNEIKKMLQDIEVPIDSNLVQSNNYLTSSVNLYIKCEEDLIDAMGVLDVDKIMTAIELCNQGTLNMNKTSEFIEGYNDNLK